MDIEIEPKSFKQRIIRASIFSFGSHIINQAIRLGSNLIMTRLLIPEYFGLMAIANLFIFGLSMLSDMGLRQSLIQSKRFDEPFINTVWTIQVIRGCVIWLLSLLLGLILYSLNLFDFWPKDSVYRDALLPYVVATIGFNMIISGFESTKLAISSRQLSLGKNVSISLISQICGITMMILWALVNKSVWAMVAGSLISSLVTTILSHTLFSGITNRFHWDKAAFDQIFHFGKWIFITSLLGFLLASSDRLILGGLVDAGTLGLYAIAFLMVGSLKDLLGSVIHNVGFPAFSEAFRSHPESLKKIYYKFRLPFDVVSIFSAGLLYAMGDLLVELLYDDRYAAAGWILQILAISIFEIRYRLTGECFMAMGKPRLLTNLILFDLVIMYTLAYTAFQFYGFKGAVWAIATTAIVTIPLIFHYKSKYGLLDWKRELMVLPLLPVGYGIGIILKQLFILIH